MTENEDKRYAVDLLISVCVYADTPEEALEKASTSTALWDDWFYLETFGDEPVRQERETGKPWTAVGTDER